MSKLLAAGLKPLTAIALLLLVTLRIGRSKGKGLSASPRRAQAATSPKAEEKAARSWRRPLRQRWPWKKWSWEKASWIATCAAAVLSLFSVGLTSVFAWQQIEINNKIADQSRRDQQAAGYTVVLEGGAVKFRNSTTAPLIGAGYWASAVSADALQDYYSALSPIPACSELTVTAKDLRVGAGFELVAAFLVYKSGAQWLGTSSDGLLQVSDESAETVKDPVEAVYGLDAHSLRLDTTLEAFSSNPQQVYKGTGPVNLATAYYGVSDEIFGKLSGYPCRG